MMIQKCPKAQEVVVMKTPLQLKTDVCIDTEAAKRLCFPARKKEKNIIIEYFYNKNILKD